MNSRSILSTRWRGHSWRVSDIGVGRHQLQRPIEAAGSHRKQGQHGGTKRNRADLVRQGLVVVARVVEEKIETVMDEIGPHGPAKALLVRSTIDADDGDISAPRW